jgi:hypothetical protein
MRVNDPEPFYRGLYRPFSLVGCESMLPTPQALFDTAYA